MKAGFLIVASLLLISRAAHSADISEKFSQNCRRGAIAVAPEPNDYLNRRFVAPGGKLFVDTYSESASDEESSFDEVCLRFCRQSDNRVIFFVPFLKQKARSFDVLWSPDAAFVAVSYKIGDTNSISTRLFSVSQSNVMEMKLPSGLSVNLLLPKDDPARNAPLSFGAVEASRWPNSTDLVCKVYGVAHLFETPVIKPGFLSICYDVTIRCTKGRNPVVLKTKQTVYENTDEGVNVGGGDPSNRGSVDAEIEYNEKAARSGDPLAQVNLGWRYEQGKDVDRDYDKAVELYSNAAKQGFAPGQAYLASMYASGKGVGQDYGKAVALFREAIINSDPFALNSYAWFLATCEDDSQRNGKQAVEYATKACNLTHWTQKNCVDTLAAAYAEAGDFDRAIMYQEQALNMNGDYPSDDVITKALQLYGNHKPYRESHED